MAITQKERENIYRMQDEGYSLEDMKLETNCSGQQIGQVLRQREKNDARREQEAKMLKDAQTERFNAALDSVDAGAKRNAPDASQETKRESAAAADDGRQTPRILVDAARRVSEYISLTRESDRADMIRFVGDACMELLRDAFFELIAQKKG